MFLNCSYFYNGWEACFAISSVYCCKFWLSRPSDIICVLQICWFCNYFSVFGYYIKFSYWTKNGQLQFVLSLFLFLAKFEAGVLIKLFLLKEKSVPLFVTRLLQYWFFQYWIPFPFLLLILLIRHIRLIRFTSRSIFH